MYKIYTKTNCTYCTAAKNMLNAKGIPFVEFNIENNEHYKETLLTEVPHAKTVPQIFENDQYIGGYLELVERMKHYDTSNMLYE